MSFHLVTIKCNCRGHGSADKAKPSRRARNERTKRGPAAIFSGSLRRVSACAAPVRGSSRGCRPLTRALVADALACVMYPPRRDERRLRPAPFLLASNPREAFIHAQCNGCRRSQIETNVKYKKILSLDTLFL